MAQQGVPGQRTKELAHAKIRYTKSTELTLASEPVTDWMHHSIFNPAAVILQLFVTTFPTFLSLF